MNRKKIELIPYYFVLFFITIIILDSIFVYLAFSSHTGLVSENSYEKGLNYNDIISQKEKQDKLNWITVTKIENKIMSLPRGHEYIRNLCEINLFHKEFVKTLGRPKQRKNLESKCIKYDRKNNALIYSFPPNLKPENYKKFTT